MDLTQEDLVDLPASKFAPIYEKVSNAARLRLEAAQKLLQPKAIASAPQAPVAAGKRGRPSKADVATREAMSDREQQMFDAAHEIEDEPEESAAAE